MNKTFNGGWILVRKMTNKYQNEHLFCEGELKFEIDIPIFEGIYFIEKSTHCYRFGIKTKLIGDIEKYNTTFVIPCEYDLENMTIEDTDGIIKNIVLNNCGDILFLNEDEIYIQILPENTELISHLDSEFSVK